MKKPEGLLHAVGQQVDTESSAFRKYTPGPWSIPWQGSMRICDNQRDEIAVANVARLQA